MELSLFSRDVIALSTAVALSHQMFDAAVYLGVCDKIVPGLIIGALSFGHLPAVFVPAGPMTSGLPNDEKGRIRQLYAEGKVTRDALLLLAASGTEDAASIAAALTQAGLSAEDLAPAEDAGLIRITLAELRFRHPLIRSAVYSSAARSQRRRVHAVLAERVAGEPV